jgi:hypothetical protein
MIATLRMEVRAGMGQGWQAKLTADSSSRPSGLVSRIGGVETATTAVVEPADRQTVSEPVALVAGDLIPDRSLTEDDDDEFDHSAIAARVADLICNGEPPLNIALFGPWGSGKSSLAELLERELSTREGPRLITYDAWKYGGSSLKRNFIAHTATELGLSEDDPAHAEFHRGLYENRRVAEVSTAQLRQGLRKLGSRFAAVFASLVFIFAALAGSASVLTNESFFGEVGRALPKFLSGSAVLALLVAVLRTVFDVGKVEVEQSKPSEDERFSTTFKRLIGRTRPNKPAATGARGVWLARAAALRARAATSIRWHQLVRWWRGDSRHAQREPAGDPFVFFIDELDRCSRRDVVATLKAIRTFLDEENCVFIVAGDRQVIERALSEAEQSTPLDEENPYYSTASAFLDKIFQHQIALPPLRGRRLTRYARNLTLLTTGGLWSELSQGVADGEVATPDLDEVLYVLIPSHVRSPRRVKVLLNNYAVNARIAQSRIRGCWPQRALEIARLTVLQTEFPDLAGDLPSEPRLPRFLLHPGSAPASELVQDLIERWDLDQDESRDSDSLIGMADALGGSTTGSDDEDPEETPDDEENGEEQVSTTGVVPLRLRERVLAVRRQRRKQLQRYLERTDDVPDIKRDLLYLQSAGEDVGLDDPELAETIEGEATDSPSSVLKALEGRPPDERLAAARLLASMVDEVLGPERRNVMTVLMEVAASLGQRVRSIDRELADSLRAYQAATELLPEHLVGAARIAALRLQDRDLLNAVLVDPRLWEDAGRVSAIAAMGSVLPKEVFPRLREAIAEHVGDDPDVLGSPLQTVDQDTAVRLLEGTPIFEAIGAAVAEPESDEQ